MKMRKPWDGSAGKGCRVCFSTEHSQLQGSAHHAPVQEAVGEHLWLCSQLTHLFGSLKVYKFESTADIQDRQSSISASAEDRVSP